MPKVDDKMLQDAFESARGLTPTDADVANVLRRSRESGSRVRSRRGVTVVLASLMLGSTAAYAVPVTRDAIDDAFSTFAGYLSGEESPESPGRAVSADDDAPDWIQGGSGRRLIAENGGYRLYAVHESGGNIGFALGENVGISDTADGWRRQLESHPLVILGPGGETRDSGSVPLFGLTASSVDHVELRYKTGDPSRADELTGGFVLLADPARQPERVIAYDVEEHALERVDVGYIKWSEEAGR